MLSTHMRALMRSRSFPAFLWALSQFVNLRASAADTVAVSYPPVIQGTVEAVAVDATGNKYVTGYFSGTLDFNPGVGSDVKICAGNFNTFVTRLNADGSYGWTQTFGGSSSDLGYGIAVSETTVYVTGVLNSTAREM